MRTFASALVFAMLPMPALAAGTPEDALWLWAAAPIALIVIGIPAAGLGYALGSFLSLPVSGFLLAILLSIPVVWLAVSSYIELATVLLTTALFFSPLSYLGWRLGHKDIMRQKAGQAVPQDGA